MVQLKVGDKAPDFTLQDSEGQPRSLHEFLGQKVVLTFFPGAFTDTCTMEVCSFRDSMARLTNMKAQVIGIRVVNPSRSKEFAEKEYLPYPMLNDVNQEVIRLYGLAPNTSGPMETLVINKSIFALDEEGIIRYIWESTNPDAEPNYDELQLVVEKIT
jgi:glutaredoxin-dependent peroxiredoxin